MRGLRGLCLTVALCATATVARGQAQDDFVHPPGIESVTVTVAGATSLDVSWRAAPRGFGEGSTITAYDVRYRKRAEAALTRHPTTGTDTSTTITGLTTGHFYYVKVRGANSAGWGEFARSLLGHMPEASHAGSVVVSTRVLSGSSVNVCWTVSGLPP